MEYKYDIMEILLDNCSSKGACIINGSISPDCEGDNRIE